MAVLTEVPLPLEPSSSEQANLKSLRLRPSATNIRFVQKEQGTEAKVNKKTIKTLKNFEEV